MEDHEEHYLGARAVVRGTVQGGPVDGDEFALPASVTSHGVLQDAVVSLCISGIWHEYELQSEEAGNNQLVYVGQRARSWVGDRTH